MKGQKWLIADLVVNAICAVAGLAAVVTGIASTKAQTDMQADILEKRYGLTPVEDEQ